MEKDKSLFELGLEYDTYAKHLQEQIDALKKLPQDYAARKRLTVLLEMQRDLKLNAEHLKSYYENRLQKRAYHKNNAYFKKESK